MLTQRLSTAMESPTLAMALLWVLPHLLQRVLAKVPLPSLLSLSMPQLQERGCAAGDTGAVVCRKLRGPRAAFDTDQQNKLLEEAELTSERALFLITILERKRAT